MRQTIATIFFCWIGILGVIVEGTCPGDPCPDPNDCRSEFDFCGNTPEHCNSDSLYRPEGCAVTPPPNGCPGQPCADPNNCRSKFDFCGTGSDYCNSESVFRPEGCAGFTPFPTSRAPTPPTRSPTVATKTPTQPTRSPTSPTNSPTPPTKSPTVVGTAAPTVATNNPTVATKSPTVATNHPTKTPTLDGATLQPTTLRPTTESPTLDPASPPTDGPTKSPVVDDVGGGATDAPDEAAAENADGNLVSIGVGGGIGGLAIAALVFARYRRKAREEALMGEKWTIWEEQALKDAFQKTHDFEELCKVVPNRSRESVAIRTKHLLEPRHANIIFPSSVIIREGYKFITERTRRFVPSAFQRMTTAHSQRKAGASMASRSHYFLSPFQSKRTTTETSLATHSIVDFENPNGTMVYAGPKKVPPPPGFKQPPRISDNPLFFTDY